MTNRNPDSNPGAPIGDPPSQEAPLRAEDQSSFEAEESKVPMMDPFTEQSTHSAGDGQEASGPTDKKAQHSSSTDNDDDEETMPVEQGFSPVP